MQLLVREIAVGDPGFRAESIDRLGNVRLIYILKAWPRVWIDRQPEGFPGRSLSPIHDFPGGNPRWQLDHSISVAELELSRAAFVR